MEIKRKDIIICGFALFAIFFGAGNLIFPPSLGVAVGQKWYVAMAGFLLSDPVLPIVGVIATARIGGRADDIGKRVSPAFAKLLGTICILTIGPFFAVPRTGAVTHEIFVSPLFPGVPIWATAIVFFGLTIYITLNPSKVIDWIGQYLTPALIAILGTVVILSIVNPPGAIAVREVDSVFKMGFYEGYQTMDALGAPLMAGIVITDLVRRGYTDKKIQFKASAQVGIVAFILLALVYGGLTYAGATVSSMFEPGSDRVAILVGLVEAILGNAGKVLLGVAVSLACLTTSSGLSSTCGNYFDSITDGKLKYKTVVLISVAISFCLSLLGSGALIAFAVPVLLAVYPIMMVLMLMALIDEKIKYNWTYTGAVVGTAVVGFIDAVHVASLMRGGNAFAAQAELLSKLPLAGIGFSWVVPAVVCAVIFAILGAVTGKSKVYGDPL